MANPETLRAESPSGPALAQCTKGSEAIKGSVRVFLLFFTIYLLTWGGHYTSGDGAQKIAWAKAILFGPSAELKPDANGVYSKYGIGHSLVAMPALAVASFIQRRTGFHCEGALYTLIFVINGALLIALIGFYLFKFYDQSRVWWTLALIGCASTWWPYTKLDFSEPLIATILFAGFVLMRFGHPVPGMLVAASTISIRTDALILVALLGGWWLLQERTVSTVLKAGVAVLPALLVVFAANWVRYHSPFDHGYDGEVFSTPLALGLTGILFSPGKSVFLFSPPLILGFFGWRRFRERPGMQLDATLFLGIFLAQLLVYSRWWDWSSDDAWGIRFMVPSVVLMCIPAVELIQRRLFVAAAGVAGVAVQILAVTAGGLDYLVMIREHQAERQALFVSGRNRVDFQDIRFNPRYSQIGGNWILLRELLRVPPQPSPPDLRNGTPLYDVVPPTVWEETAHWDFIWARRQR